MEKAEKSQSVGASFFCRVCGGEASHVTLVPPGQPNPGCIPETPDMLPGASRMFIDEPRLSIRGGPVSVMKRLPGKYVEGVKDALLAGSAAQLYAIHDEFAPFWCPKCGCCYCKEHYSSYVVYDDTFFDYIHGTCPEGHERILID